MVSERQGKGSAKKRISPKDDVDDDQDEKSDDANCEDAEFWKCAKAAFHQDYSSHHAFIRQSRCFKPWWWFPPALKLLYFVSQQNANLQNNFCAEMFHQSALLISNSMLHCRVVFGWTLLTKVNSWIKDCLLWLRLPWRLCDMNLKCSKSLLLTTTIKLDYVSFLNTPRPPLKRYQARPISLVKNQD